MPFGNDGDLWFVQFGTNVGEGMSRRDGKGRIAGACADKSTRDLLPQAKDPGYDPELFLVERGVARPALLVELGQEGNDVPVVDGPAVVRVNERVLEYLFAL